MLAMGVSLIWLANRQTVEDYCSPEGAEGRPRLSQDDSMQQIFRLDDTDCWMVKGGSRRLYMQIGKNGIGLHSSSRYYRKKHVRAVRVRLLQPGSTSETPSLPCASSHVLATYIDQACE